MSGVGFFNREIVNALERVRTVGYVPKSMSLRRDIAMWTAPLLEAGQLF